MSFLRTKPGPNASKAGYASVTEAYSGFRHINGEAGEPPVRPNISLGDTVAGMHAAFGVLLALLARQNGKAGGGQRGQVVDVALYESMFNMMEGIVPEYDGAGLVRGPSGSTLTGIVPTNTYLCRDGKHVVIGANGPCAPWALCGTAGRRRPPRALCLARPWPLFAALSWVGATSASAALP